ncbi:MAG: phage integrase SAM-like domain-containing protein, partial [bacterium]|nr:phage integrase SAM-like domain-containing protein [bacterium]
MNPNIQSYIQDRLPRGIRLNRNSLLIDVSKKVMHNGQEKIIRKSKSVLLGLDEVLDNLKAKKLFDASLDEAIRLQTIMQREIAQSGYAEIASTTKIGDGSIGAIWARFMPKLLAKMAEQNAKAVNIYYNDVVEYFTQSKLLKDITEDEIDKFKEWLKNKIECRANNAYGSSGNGTVNKRLGLIRELMRTAIKNKYLTLDECIDPTKKNLGVVDLPRSKAKQKPALSLFEQSEFIAVMRKYGDDHFANMMEFAFETGMRHSTELNTFKITDVNFSRGSICFWRNKTNSWSIEMPLTNKAFEIVSNYREVAERNPDGKVFPCKKNYIRHKWNKYK